MGSLTGSGLADSLGRKKALIASALPMLAGALLSATATGLWAMVAGRVLVGVGIGLSSALVPLYISEISPPKVRCYPCPLNFFFFNAEGSSEGMGVLSFSLSPDLLSSENFITPTARGGGGSMRTLIPGMLSCNPPIASGL